MSLRPTIQLLLEDFHANILPVVSSELVRRDLSLGTPQTPKIGSNAKTIIGMRRSGKTFRLYQEMIALIESGVTPERICYFNFDDDRVRPYPAGFIALVLETFFDLHPESRSKGTFVFFDEVQDVPEWGIAARRILDTEKVTLYLTGSSSRLLAEDVATEFRGRSIAYELAPYSFREYLRTRGIEPTGAHALLNKETVSHIRSAFERYLAVGGFPAACMLDNAERVQLLQGYAQLTVARDVVERSRFSNASYARSLARSALASSARDASISKIDHRGKSSGYSPGRAKIAELLDAFEDAHLVYQLYDFGYSAQKSRLGGMKLYAADPGLYWANIPAPADGSAHALETAVYLELRRRRKSGRFGDIAMLKLPSGKEVDFVEGDAASEHAETLVQVSYTLEDTTTEKREITALREAMKRFSHTEGTIVTADDERELAVAEGIIRIVPAWKWFLGA